MHGTNQPVFMSGVKLDEIAIVRLQPQNSRTKHRNIVIMNDVKFLAEEDFENGICLEPGSSGLLGKKRREESPTAPQAMNCHIGVIRKLLVRLASRKHPIAIHAVNHVYFVATLGEGIRQPTEIHGVSAETVRRIEAREKAESKWACHGLT